MLVTCWSVKGGVGTTVVAAALARAMATRSAEGALLVDLAGDAAHALGVPDPPGPGVAEWLRAGASTLPDALTRLASPLGDGLDLLPRGHGRLEGARVPVLGSVLLGAAQPVVVDAGCLDGLDPQAAPVALASIAPRSLLVIRPCQLALRRARRLPATPSGVVLVREPARALGRRAVERVVGAPVVVELAVDPAVARAVDAGLLSTRMPRAFAAAVAAIA